MGVRRIEHSRRRIDSRTAADLEPQAGEGARWDHTDGHSKDKTDPYRTWNRLSCVRRERSRSPLADGSACLSRCSFIKIASCGTASSRYPQLILKIKKN